jgi:hypothetical protein
MADGVRRENGRAISRRAWGSLENRLGMFFLIQPYSFLHVDWG